MPHTRSRAVLGNPVGFAVQVVRAFLRNQGMLLSAALAYYTLLSIVPLFTILLLALSQVIDEQLLLDSVARYLTMIVPAQSADVLAQIKTFLSNRHIAGWVVIGTLLFFSTMAFGVLERAMTVIFEHRVAIKRRHFLISASLPYAFIVLLGFGLLLTSTIAGALQAISGTEIALLGRTWSFDRFSVALVYLIGLVSEIAMITAIYLAMPVGRLSVRHALIGGVVAAILWDLTRRVLVWYFATLSFVNLIYGSLATLAVALLSLQVACVILLLGAQVIAEYERPRENQSPSSGDPAI